MKSNLKKKGLLTILGCLMFSIAMMFGAMFSEGSFVAFASEADDKLAPAIVSVAGIAIGDSNMGGFPSAIVGEEYKDPDGKQYEVVATGSGTLTYTANEYSTGGYGRMPEGLHLDSTTGKFSGTITSTGEFNVLITVSNEYGSAQAFCRIKVYEASDKPTITTESLSNGAVGSYYKQTIEYSGYSSQNPTCEVISGALPNGLTFGTQYGDPTIYGTPTATGSFTFTVSINNGVDTATKEYSLTITEETVRPYLINSATIVNESDKYSSIEARSSLYIHVVKGKEVNVQLVSSGTNTTDNQIKYTVDSTDCLPTGLTMSESGLITGTVSNDIETSSGEKQFNTYITIGNTTVGGDPQSSSTYIYVVVHDNGYVNWMALDPSTTSVAKGGTRQFEIVWDAYGDVDKTAVTWSFVGSLKPTSSQTTISDTGLLTVGVDETRTTLYVRATYNSSKIADATITVVDHTHTTTLVEEKAKTCTEDGNIAHYKCTICDELFEDALATKTLSADKIKISAGHDYGTIISKVPATCSSTGKEAHYKCSVCNKIFTSEKVETTEDTLEIAIVPTAHKFGTWQNEVSANCAEKGAKAHKTCEYCNKHFDSDGTEITDLAIEKNEDHLKQADVWTKDASGHWHACTREGCKDGGKLDFVEHTPSAAEATETTDVHCTECGYVIESVKDHVHNLKTIYGHSNTCYADGAKTYYECSEGEHPCNKYFEDATGLTEITEDINTWKVIPAGHNFGDMISATEPTCASTGELAHKTCSVCHCHFDVDGNKIANIVVEKNDDHLVTDTETLENDQYGHWHACTREGCKNNGKADYTEHTKSATEATEKHDIHCTVCGFILEPLKGHVHSLSKIDGYAETCTTDGAKTYWVCSGGDYPCNKYFEDSDGTTEITASRLNAWKTIPAAPHTFGDWIEEVPATIESTGTKAHKDCSVCEKHFDNEGNEIDDLTIAKLTPTEPTDPTDPVTPTDPTDPTEPTKPTEEDNNSLSAGAIAGIAAGSVAVAGIGGFAIFWFVIKKKKWADLIAVFKKLFKKN